MEKGGAQPARTCVDKGRFVRGGGRLPRPTRPMDVLEELCSGPPGPVWPEEALAGVGLRHGALEGLPRPEQVGEPWFSGWASLLRHAQLTLPKEASPTGGKGHSNGSPAFYTPLNNCISPPWWPGLPLQTFLAVEPFPPASSGCLLTTNRYLLPGSTIQTPLSSTQPSYTPLRLGCAGLWHRLYE